MIWRQGQGSAFAQHQQQQMAAQLTLQQPRLMLSPQGLILQNGLIMPILQQQQQQQQQSGGGGAGVGNGSSGMGSMQHGTLVPSGFQLQASGSTLSPTRTLRAHPLSPLCIGV